MCVPDCPSNQYKNAVDNTCTDCNSQCTTCTGGSNLECLSCTLPYYFESASKQCSLTCNSNEYQSTTLPPECLSCNSTCFNCSGPSSTECLSCAGNLYFNSSANTCVYNCPDGSYSNTSDNTCSLCDSSCATCSGGVSSDCLLCPSASFF